MVAPAALAALGPLFAEAGGTAAGTAAVGQAASATAASTAATEGLTAALTQALAGGGGGGAPGGQTGFGLGGKVPETFTKGLKGAFPVFALLGKLVKPITTLPKQLEDWGQSLLDARRNLMAFNGAIAGVILEAERRDIVRKMGEGQRVSGSTEFLSEGLSDLKDEFQPLKDVIVNGFNMIAGGVLRVATIATSILKYHPVIAIGLGIQRLLTGDDKDEKVAFLRFVDDIKKGAMEEGNDHGALMGNGPDPGAGAGEDLLPPTFS